MKSRECAAVIIQYRLQTVLTEKVKSVEDVIKESCEILSDMTNLASVVLGANSDTDTLTSIQLIPLTEKTATAVFVTNKGYVENKTFVLKDDLQMKDVQRVIELLNERLKGTPLSSIVEKMEALKILPWEEQENRLLLERGERLYEESLGSKREFIAEALTSFKKAFVVSRSG